MSPAGTNAQSTPELHLLPEEERVSPRHFAALAIASIIIHILGIAFFLSLPDVIPPPNNAEITPDLHRAVHLVLPRTFEPTQKAPNVSKVVRPELDVRSQLEAAQSQAPKFTPPHPAPGPVRPPVPMAAPPVAQPRIQVAQTPPPPTPATIAPPANPNGVNAQAPPPPASSHPTLAFQNVAPAPATEYHGWVDPRLLMHPANVQPATDRRPSGGGGLTVGDSGDDLSRLPTFDQSQSKGRMGSNLQLLSDATGFDFKPYLMKVLAAVRRNWLAAIPESAHMGRRGQVLIQFIIDRRGSVPKLVIASSSGTEAFDRAAVSGVTLSDPFPPLPDGFKGDQIRLQLAFSYNAPRH